MGDGMASVDWDVDKWAVHESDFSGRETLVEDQHNQRQDSDVKNLIQPDLNDERSGVDWRSFYYRHPPHERDARVDPQMCDADQQCKRPRKNQHHQQSMDTGVDPASRVVEIRFVEHHPLGLQHPIGNQVGNNSPNQDICCCVHSPIPYQRLAADLFLTTLDWAGLVNPIDWL